MHHIFTGSCHRYKALLNAQACKVIGADFEGESEIVCAACNQFITSRSLDFPHDHLLTLLSSLKLDCCFIYWKLRQSGMRKLKYYCSSFASHGRGQHILPPVMFDIFMNFNKLSRAVLVQYCMEHGVACDQFTGSTLHIQRTLSEHILVLFISSFLQNVPQTHPY